MFTIVQLVLMFCFDSIRGGDFCLQALNFVSAIPISSTGLLKLWHIFSFVKDELSGNSIQPYSHISAELRFLPCATL